MNALSHSSDPAPIQRRRAVKSRHSHPRRRPAGPRPCPPSRPTSRLNTNSLPPPSRTQTMQTDYIEFPSPHRWSALPPLPPSTSSIPELQAMIDEIEDHRLSMSSMSSMSSSSSHSSVSSLDMPMTPPPIIWDLPAQSIPKSLPTYSMDSHPSIRPTIYRGYSDSAQSTYSQISPVDEVYDPEKVRYTRLKIAQDLLARRQLERSNSTASQWSLETADWQRGMDFTEWQAREAEALAKQRKAEWATRRGDGRLRRR